jgi:excisionase family DNA binding protein
MKRSAGVAGASARLLLKKSEVCRLLSVSGATLERLLDDGRLPAPVWLGATMNSRRWLFSTLQTHVSGLAKSADRAATAVHV